MGFKIVTFLKKRKNSAKVEYSFVPENWEKNGEIFWPKNNAETLRKIASSMPEDNWFRYRGIVKKKDIQSLQEAQLWEEEFVNAPDTEAEENLTITNPKKKIIGTPKNQVCQNSENVNAYESMFAETERSMEENLAVIDIADTPIEIINLEKMTHAENMFHLIGNNNTTENSINYNDIDIEKWITEMENLKGENKILNQVVNNMDSRLKTVLLVVEKIFSLLNSKIDNTDNIVNENVNNQEELELKFSFPIDEVEALSQFDKEIQLNATYKSFLIQRFTKVGGIGGKENGDKVGRNLISIMFNTGLLTKFSWTGISRTSGVDKKLAFQSFDGITSLFFEIIKKADCRWCDQTNIKFFRDKILKHSKKINEIFEKNKKKKFLKDQQTVADGEIRGEIVQAEDGIEENVN